MFPKFTCLKEPNHCTVISFTSTDHLHEAPAVVEIILTMKGIPVPSCPIVQSPLHHIAVFSGSDMAIV